MRVAFFVLCGSISLLPAQDIDAALARLVGEPALADARVGVCVRTLEGGTIVATHDDAKGFMTASNMKLISSAVALLTLGPDFVFKTELVARGTVADGVLDGDLVLVGSGDPTLGGRHEPDGPTAPFDRFARALRETHGIHTVTGAVLGDDDCHADEVMGAGWSWAYEGEDYAAQVSGLCFAENFVRLQFPATAAGRTPGLRVVPETAYLTFDVDVRADGKTTGLDVRRVRAGNKVRVRGTLAADKPASATVTMDNPTAFAATVLRERLLAAGITVRGRAADLDTVTSPLRPERVVLATHASPPLREILVTLNKVSQNLYAEQLPRAAARAAGLVGDMASAEAHAKEVLRGLGVDVSGMEIADGSGLTRLNLVQPRQLVALLLGMHRHAQRDLFISTLPIAGVDGTLGSRFKEGPAKGTVRAKTGYISRVVCLSGYAGPYAFSVMLNNFTCSTQAAKDAVDAFVTALVATGANR